ncbi:acyl-CoA-binding protein [Streptomyces sp. NPDC047967]|uniref:acyl-CoA-binding protein n=1 Tax=unclassified Streptomyces TaxID=2593676 RepID=UPI0034101DCA
MSVGLDNAEFAQLAEQVKHLPSNPDNATLLKFYAYFKQATVGDNNTEAPGLMDFTGKAKWNAWSDLKGMEQTDATLRYIEAARDMIAKHS